MSAQHTPGPRKPVAIDSKTRWVDSKARAWRVLENLHFGRYLCVLADNAAYSGEWTSKDIRAAIAKARGGESCL